MPKETFPIVQTKPSTRIDGFVSWFVSVSLSRGCYSRIIHVAICCCVMVRVIGQQRWRLHHFIVVKVLLGYCSLLKTDSCFLCHAKVCVCSCVCAGGKFCLFFLMVASRVHSLFIIDAAEASLQLETELLGEIPSRIIEQNVALSVEFYAHPVLSFNKILGGNI